MMNKTCRQNFLAMMGYKTTEDFQRSQSDLLVDGSWEPATDAKAASITRGIQKRLNVHGAGLAVDGSPGPATKAAIIAFKKAHGLSATIKVGPKTKELLYKDQSEQLSTHFRKSEFRCECGGRYCNGYNGYSVNAKLIDILEEIREECGDRSITITSGIRCQKYNDSLVGSVKNSPHLYGKAADIYIAGVTDTASGRAKVKRLAYKHGAAYCYYGTANMGSAVHINV